MARVGLVGSDISEGGYSRVLVEILDGRACWDKGVEVYEALGLLIMGMSRWWKRQITQVFCKSLRRSSST